MNSEVENTLPQNARAGNASVSILDESLFTGEKKQYNLFCSVDAEFISIAAVDAAQMKFVGFEGFHFPKGLSDEQLSAKITSLAEQSSILKKVDFRNVSVQVSNSLFTFIPKALFKKEDAEQYYYFNHQSVDGIQIHHELIRAYDMVNIFSVPEKINVGVKKLFEQFTFHHHLSSLLEAAKFHTQKQVGKVLFVHIHSSSIDVVVTEERKLLLANSFSFKSVEDALYFVLMVCEHLALNPEKIPVVLSGEIEKASALSNLLHKYIRNIELSERIKTVEFTYGFDQLPAHFYHSAFSHILCEL